jgi:hypothetical protein
MSQMTFRDAINMTLDEALGADPAVLLFGEDIGQLGGAFQVTKGLWQKYAYLRVSDNRHGHRDRLRRTEADCGSDVLRFSLYRHGSDSQSDGENEIYVRREGRFADRNQNNHRSWSFRGGPALPKQ